MYFSNLRSFTILVLVLKINEYNRNNEFKDTPWIYTFKDGLASCWNGDHMEYFSIGLNMHTIRMYYNKTLFKKYLNRDEPLKTFEELNSDNPLLFVIKTSLLWRLGHSEESIELFISFKAIELSSD